MTRLFRSSPAALLAAVSLAASHALVAQTVSDYIGPPVATTGAETNWTRDTNWTTDFVPNAPDALVRFGPMIDPDTERVNILFSNTNLAGVLQVSAFEFLPDFVSTQEVFLVRNYSSGTAGMIKIYGNQAMINGTPTTLLVGNFGSSQEIRFSNENAGMGIELQTSGVIHNEGTGLLRFSVPFFDAEGQSFSVTKTGEGILRFDRRNATYSSELSTYTGGFILEQGIVEYTNSGSTTSNPFGLGPIVLRGGNFRSTTSGGRSTYNDIVLDGNVELGSLDPDFNGGFTVNSSGGEKITTIASDSVLTVHNNINWHQATQGDHSLTKAGEGTLRFSGLGGDVAHTGPTVITGGTLNMEANLSASTAEVQAGATLTGFGTFSQAVTVRSGATLAPTTGENTSSEWVSTTMDGDLMMEAGAFLAFNLNGTDNNRLVIKGGADFGGGLGDVILDLSLGFQPEVNDVFVLVDNQTGNPLLGSFNLDGLTLGEGDQFVVASGEFSQLFEATFGHNGDSFAVVAVPEPSTLALLLGASALGVVFLRRRRS